MLLRCCGVESVGNADFTVLLGCLWCCQCFQDVAVLRVLLGWCCKGVDGMLCCFGVENVARVLIELVLLSVADAIVWLKFVLLVTVVLQESVALFWCFRFICVVYSVASVLVVLLCCSVCLLAGRSVVWLPGSCLSVTSGVACLGGGCWCVECW